MPEHNEFRVFGPPGTGKTTWLAQQINRALYKYQPEEIMACSFTRTAAKKLAGHDTGLPRRNIGTIHSLCYHALGRPTIIDGSRELLKEWNSRYPAYEVSRESTLDEVPRCEGDLLQWNRQRSMLAAPAEPGGFSAAWEEFKLEHDCVDFTDLLLRAPDSVDAKVLFVDEAQDMTPLEWRIVRRWGEQADTFVVCGDDDQCQPGDTVVETTRGPKRMCDLAADDRLLAYDKHEGRLCGWQRGYSFRMARRRYSGLLYRVRTLASWTSCTDGHRWLARWTAEAKRGGWKAVYLMRRGDHYRVGWAQMFRADGCCHLNVRANLDAADGLWILKVFASKEDCYAYEAVCAAMYGIPTATFTNHMDTVFANVDSRRGAKRALKDHGLRIDRPLIDRVRPNFSRYGSAVMTVAACNLIGGLMEVPTYEGSTTPLWRRITVSTERARNVAVYSLDVEKHHTYVADNLVTCNCIYSFIGAEPRVFLSPLPPEQKRILRQSWRLPEAILERAATWVAKLDGRREPKDFAPRQEKGLAVERDLSLCCPDALASEIADVAADGRTALVLSSCGYMLIPLLDELRERGVPFHNPFRPERGDWSPLAKVGSRLTAFLECCRWDGPPLPASTWWRWVECVDADHLNRGAKAKLKELAARPEGRVDEDEVVRWLPKEVVGAMMEQDVAAMRSWLLERYRKALGYPARVLAAHGEAALRDSPRVMVGTIHSVKGEEADVVYLAPDLSFEAWKGTQQAGAAGDEARDTLVRQFYVGMTRARQELHLLSNKGSWRVRWK